MFFARVIYINNESQYNWTKEDIMKPRKNNLKLNLKKKSIVNLDYDKIYEIETGLPVIRGGSSPVIVCSPQTDFPRVCPTLTIFKTIGPD
jgi:hypothetical protein